MLSDSLLTCKVRAEKSTDNLTRGSLVGCEAVLSCCFQDSLSLVFDSWIIKCLGVGLLGFILLPSNFFYLYAISSNFGSFWSLFLPFLFWDFHNAYVCLWVVAHKSFKLSFSLFILFLLLRLNNSKGLFSDLLNILFESVFEPL